MIDSLRTAQGLKKGAFSKSQKDADEWRLFEQTVNQAREAFAALPEGESHDTIDKAVLNVRKQKRRSRGRSRN